MSRNHGYAVIDFETTGVHNQHAIIEIGVVLLRPDLSVEKTWEALVHPQQPIPNSRIHGITDQDVAQAPIFEELAPHLKYLLHGRVLVAHNVGFEKRFLRNEFQRAGMRDTVPDSWVDTMTLSSHYLGVKKLSEALAIADIPNPLAHSALSDASATADLLRYLHVEHLAPITGYPTAAFAERSPSQPARTPTRSGGVQPTTAGSGSTRQPKVIPQQVKVPKPEVPTRYAGAGLFPWLTSVPNRPSAQDHAGIAQAWIATFPKKPLAWIADNLHPTTQIDGAGTGLEPYIALWKQESPKMLAMSADKLLALPGVGKRRQAMLVELVVAAAAGQAVPQATPAQPEPTQTKPAPVEAPRSHLGDPIIPRMSNQSAPYESPTALPAAPHAAVTHEPAPKAKRSDGAATWFKWSAAVSVATFLALGIGGVYMGLDPESGLSITLALGWMVSTFVAVVSGVIAFFRWAGRKD